MRGGYLCWTGGVVVLDRGDGVVGGGVLGEAEELVVSHRFAQGGVAVGRDYSWNHVVVGGVDADRGGSSRGRGGGEAELRHAAVVGGGGVDVEGPFTAAATGGVIECGPVMGGAGEMESPRNGLSSFVPPLALSPC